MELSGILYICASTLFIIVGILHLIVHFNQLISLETKEKFSSIENIKVIKRSAQVWKLWKGMSLLFGVLLTVLGINNILSLLSLGEKSHPSILICIVNIIVLIIIIYTGFKYFSKMQIYGGFLGLILFIASLFFAMN